jgi:hypothetical protein
MSKDDEEKKDLTKTPTSLSDGFDVESDYERVSSSVIRGTLIKFTNEAKWVSRDGELPAGLELLVVEILRVVTKWGPDQKPLETRILRPDEKFPDIDALNEGCPQSEWVQGPDKKLHGPYQKQYVGYLLDLNTMQQYSYPTSTAGGGIAVRGLRDQTKWMRKLRGRVVYPTVKLGHTFMKTGFGGRQRPDLVVQRWVTFGGDGGDVKALPTPGPTLSPSQEVERPSLAEELNDAIPDFGKPVASDQKDRNVGDKPKLVPPV